MIEKLIDMYYWVYRHITDLPYYFKHVRWSYQRVRYGICSKDTWGLDYHIANVMVRALLHLKENQHGIPASMLYNKSGKQVYSDEEAIERWNDILDNIIVTFDIVRQVHDNDLLIPESEEHRLELEYKCGFGSYRILTMEETKVFHRGFDLFKEYYFSLWD